MANDTTVNTMVLCIYIYFIFYFHINKKKLYCPFLEKGFTCLETTEAIQREKLLLTTKFSRNPDTHLNDFKA